jgi:lysozyme
MNDALEAAIPLIKRFEGLCLRAYPDPASLLSRALSSRNLLRKYKEGRAEIPDDLRHLSGAPWTIGYGETLGVKEGMWWTLEQAEQALRRRVAQFMLGVLKRCPQLHLEPPCRLAACTSLAYNIGLGNFGASQVCRLTRSREFTRAKTSFKNWNKAMGKVVAGLVARRGIEAQLYGEADAVWS